MKPSGIVSWLSQSIGKPAKPSTVPLSDILGKQNESNRTVFHFAIEEKLPQIVSHLLQLGADVESTIPTWDGPVPPLYHAARHGQEEIVLSLLSHGANVEATDIHGWSPLHGACFNGQTSIVKALLDAGALVHATTRRWNDDYTKPSGLYRTNEWKAQPLHLAALSGNIEIVRLLLDRGADIHASTGHRSVYAPAHGPTALYMALDTKKYYGRIGSALDEGRLAIAQLLIDRGASVEGVADHLTIRDTAMFKDCPGLWDTLRAGISAKDPKKS
jgi:hypothetical protein